MFWRYENGEPVKVSFGQAWREAAGFVRRAPLVVAGWALAGAVLLSVLYVTSYDRFHENRKARFEERRGRPGILRPQMLTVRRRGLFRPLASARPAR